MILDLNFVYQTLTASAPEHNASVGKISTDSKEDQSNCVFFALRGEHFDGHDFVADVLNKNPLAVVVAQDFALTDKRLIRVNDTLQALGTLAHAWRMAVNPKVFGITGSSGKTTVKEMLSGMLRHHAGDAAVLSTQGNYNNEIGLPLTLLALKPTHRFAVIEMGMNHFGELARLTRIACPDVALVNNAQRVHIGCGFNGVADIARAKSEIYQGLSDRGIACYPCEDEHANVFLQSIGHRRTVRFGLHSGDVYAKEIKLMPLSSQFTLQAGAQSVPVYLPVAGKHNIANAIAAIALAQTAGVSLAECADSLQNFKNIKGRLQEKVGKNGARIIDDTYNANPDSMKAAIDVLAQFASPRILVMGDLGELGDTAPQLHAEVGAYARDAGVDYFFAVGELCQNAAEAFGADARHFMDKETAVLAILPLLQEQTSILVKGSRFMKMEQVVERLVCTGS